MEKLSLTYKMLRFIGLNFPEETYGNVSIFKVLKRLLKTFKDAFLMKYLMNSVLLSPLNPRMIRPIILRWVGCKVGKDVFIGADVFIDSGHAELILIEDHVHIAGRCMLLCHKRNLSNYCIGDDYAKVQYMTEKIHLKKGCAIGTNTLIMPGVTIGEGSIVGAYSLVTKDVPSWTISLGRPAVVVKHIPERSKL